MAILYHIYIKYIVKYLVGLGIAEKAIARENSVNFDKTTMIERAARSTNNQERTVPSRAQRADFVCFVCGEKGRIVTTLWNEETRCPCKVFSEFFLYDCDRFCFD
jgi:hypothetical protein